MNPTLRGKTYHLRKRVPLRFAAIEPRETVWISLHTDSEKVAKTKAPAAWSEMLEAWEAMLAGQTDKADEYFEAAKQLAQARGFRYLPADRVAKLPIENILERVDSLRGVEGKLSQFEASAILGGVAEPTITVTRALEAYWVLAKDKTFGKSKDQLRRWRNPRMKAVKNFVDVVGDKALAEITADDMLDFRQWWVEKIETEDLTPNSANKDLVHLGDVLKTVNRMKRLGLSLPLSDLSLKEGEKGQRPPFSNDWITGKLLAPKALDGLNLEARCILLGMVNTGYRPSEGACLGTAQIRLDTAVPHISIEPNGRQLKSAYARRIIPLAGVSLEAFRACPEGFPRYADNPSLSATVNKYLRDNGLLESAKHSMYSLRHAFEDRMLAAGVDDRIRRDLFGHSLDRERYGKGASLEQLHEIIQRLAF
jgi:integrase